VSNFFHDLVGDVLAQEGQEVDREKLRTLILESAQSNKNLKDFGVESSRVTLPELSDAPMTQISRLIRVLVNEGGRVLRVEMINQAAAVT
jgi:hypothetical protein